MKLQDDERKRNVEARRVKEEMKIRWTAGDKKLRKNPSFKLLYEAFDMLKEMKTK